jgi:anti-sigma B factor antagonist
MGSFALKTVRRDGAPAPVLSVRGDLDIYTAPEFEQRLLDLANAEPRGLVVDLSASSFVDASACRALLRVARRLRDHASQLVVVNRDEEIARVFDIMGLEEFLTVVRSRSDAQRLLTAV